MGVILILLSASLIIALIFLSAFLWSVKRGQYDDTMTPAMRILVDDVQPQPSPDSDKEIPT